MTGGWPGPVQLSTSAFDVGAQMVVMGTGKPPWLFFCRGAGIGESFE